MQEHRSGAAPYLAARGDEGLSVGNLAAQDEAHREGVAGQGHDKDDGNGVAHRQEALRVHAE